MAAPLAAARSVRRRRLSSVVEETPSFAAKLPSVDRGDVIEMDRMLDTLLNGVSKILMYEVRSWQNRPLESVYAIVYFDALVVTLLFLDF